MHKKEVLSEFIYSLNCKNSFKCTAPMWSSPVVGFAYNNTLPSKFLRDLKRKAILSESIDTVICILGDWETVAEGIIFTDRAIYVHSPKNSERTFNIRYDEIDELQYLSNIPELIIKSNNVKHSITTDMWSKRNIHDYLQFASERYQFDSKNKAIISEIKLKYADNYEVGNIASGITYGSISNAASMYFDDKLATPRGHGFAAEHANHLVDIYQGKNAVIIGDDNAKNGADRLVDGVQIQSKYCASGSKCVQECFENGTFRYYNGDGTPMQIEVPSDMYESAIQAMERRIQRGEISGVTDPSAAKNIIRKGYFTYTQAKNIAKAGTVESICYDAASGAIIATNAFGITTVLSFATSIWSGDQIDIALKSAAAQGLKVGGTTFITSVLAGQFSKAGLNSALVGSSETIVRIMGPKASAVLVNSLRSGTNIYGAAAMKSAAKLLRSNAITGAVSFAVLSVGDVGNIFQGRISGGQLFKNLTNTAASVAGGGAGWVAGSAVGAAIGSFIPIIGTGVGAVVGGLAGAFGGGTAASSATGAILDQFIEDDAEHMVKIIQEVFTKLAEEYLTLQDEAERIADKLKEKLTGSILKDMYASADRQNFARLLLENYFKDETYNRKHIYLPSVSQMRDGLRAVLEDVADRSTINATL